MSDKFDLDEEIEEKPFNIKLLQRTLNYFSPYKKSMAVVSVLLIVGLVAGLLDPLFIRSAIDEGIMKSDISIITRVGLILLGLYIINFVSAYLRIKIVNKVSQGIIFDIRKQLFEHIQSLSFKFFDGRPAGKIISRITNDVQAISDLISNGLATMISESLVIVGILIIIFTIDFKLSLMAVSVIPFLVLILARLKPKSEKAWSKTRKTVANINANLNETLQGIRVIQAFSRQKHNISKFDMINKENYKSHIVAICIELLFWPLVELIGLLGTCVVIWYGARQVINGEQTVGTIVAFINYLWRFWSPLSALSKVYSQVLSAMASSERIFQIIDTPAEIMDSSHAVDVDNVQGHIKFENVTFGYNPEERMVLHNISFEAKPGEIIALVGPTGAGKSSIINLLMRFYDPVDGRILVDGHDIRDVKIASLRSQIGMVLQESFIFSGTIRENILYGKLDAVPEEIMDAAKATKVLNFAEKFKDGFETQVEERGAKLSSGQRQLLAFARALVSNPRILILDEATSSVDTETERHIQEALRTMFSGRTSIVIAHRLSTIEHADKIIVVDDGRIVEQGKHEELIANKGMYYRLYLKQFQDEDLDQSSEISA